jgi:hypothetical protein
MGLLDGDLAESIYQGFKGKLLSGIFYQRIVPESGALDALGDPTDLGYTPTPCEGFTDGYSAFTRAQAGIPETDLKLCIFANSMPGVVPTQGNFAVLNTKLGPKWYEVRKRATDPAVALWECQAFEIPEPTL